MQKKLAKQIKTIAEKFSDLPVSTEYLSRAKDGSLTRDENSSSHFCVYFAAFDPDHKEIFLGLHKKSGLWLFNGGHIDKGEILEETLVREMGEEWGIKIDLKKIGEPELITITDIDNPNFILNNKCAKHFDIWYLVPVSKTIFYPDKEKLDTEFSEIGWKSIEEARTLVVDLSTLIAITEFEKIFNRNS